MRSLLAGPLVDDLLDDIDQLAELEGLDEAAVAELEAMDDAHLIEAYAYPEGRAWVRANMITSVDGAVSYDGRSGSLSGHADQRVFGVLRGLADVVVVGAQTVRVEGYDALKAKPAYAALRASHGQQPAPVLAVVTSRAELDLDGPLFTDPSRRPVIVTSEAAPQHRLRALEKVAQVVVAGEDRVDLVAALDRLVTDVGPRILCEGGPHLLHDVVSAGLLDEICVTLAPLLVSGEASRLMAGSGFEPPRALRLAGLLEEGGSLFARYLVG